MDMKILTYLILYLILTGCTICSIKSLQDAERYQDEGYKVRVAAYCVGIDGYLWGMGLWSAHAQAQVFKDGEWLWVGEFGNLTQYSTFTKRTMPGYNTSYVWWTLPQWVKYLAARERNEHVGMKNPCDLF
jgi:hypothetical protein